MKLVLTLVSILFSFESSFSQSAGPDTLRPTSGSFLNIAWGEPAETARRKMLATPDVQFEKELKTGQAGTTLVFGGGKLLGVDARSIELEFTDNHFFSARATMAVGAGRQATDVYGRMKAALISAYGRPVNEVPPGGAAQGASSEGLISALWSFPVEGEMSNSIYLKSEGADRVLVEFHNGRMLNEAWQRGDYR